ncbi:MAG: Delta(1)-pyrroline-2-carboxylate reductase [Herbaspirillum frisingense]|uniref:Delta(1)-pyrroline-2-carboxylate reductase n=1 Tax=Herbaspirillum frisingense TaxID=92645 RepID=A0A7V8JVR3_9BURK|nr:MAG: Delta(1)-pyrroline-2-carboxylate reductase [Herbaspirillum frisingense]
MNTSSSSPATSSTAEARLLLLDKHAVEALLTPEAVLPAVREAFLLHAAREGRVFPLVREALSTGGVFGIKSGDVPSQGLLGFKAAGFWPANRALGGEPHQATIMLISPETGRPLCIIDGNAVTTMRTGAAGALGLMQLARPDSRRLTIFGIGVQARIQLRFALDSMPSLQQVRYAGSRGERDAGFEQAFAARCDIAPAADRNQAVADSDIVITATPGKGALFDADAVQPGTHLNCVGADTKGKRELPQELLQRARICVDDAAQARQVGEMQWAPELPVVELGDLLGGQARLERADDDITLFDMTGLALQDLTVARRLYRQALEDGQPGVAWPW